MEKQIEIKRTCARKVLISSPETELVSIEECQEYLGKFNLNDKKVEEIRNYLSGVVDKSLSIYMDNFR